MANKKQSVSALLHNIASKIYSTIQKIKSLSLGRGGGAADGEDKCLKVFFPVGALSESRCNFRVWAYHINVIGIDYMK